ncbi:MAG: LacI family transcriptional regulator, partial [Thermoflexus sp.]
VFRPKMAALAVARLLDLIQHPEQPALHIRMETQLIIRQSCGSPPIPS